LDAFQKVYAVVRLVDMPETPDDKCQWMAPGCEHLPALLMSRSYNSTPNIR